MCQGTEELSFTVWNLTVDVMCVKHFYLDLTRSQLLHFRNHLQIDIVQSNHLTTLSDHFYIILINDNKFISSKLFISKLPFVNGMNGMYKNWTMVMRWIQLGDEFQSKSMKLIHS